MPAESAAEVAARRATSEPPADGSVLAMFAALAALGAFVIAVISVIVVSTKEVATSSKAATPVPVSMTEFSFSPSTPVIEVGGAVALTNAGAQVHNLEVRDGPKSPDLQAGQSAELDLSSLGEGTYEFFCNIPGHAEAGMRGTLAVVPAGSGQVAADSAQAAGDEHAGLKYAASDRKMSENLDRFLEAATTGVPLTKGVGNQILEPVRIEPDGTKVFELEAIIADWEVEPGRTVKAWTYNGMVPAPWIKVGTNEKLRFEFTNSLPASSDIHWHGIDVPNDQDGVAPLTQPYVQPGETYIYEFTTSDRPQLGMYHPHNHGQIAIPNGMMGIFQVGDVPLPAGGIVGGIPVPDDIELAQEIPMVLNDAGVIGLTLNGKGYPATAPIVSAPGDWSAIHYLNEGLQIHPMHLHGMPQLVISKDGIPLDQPYWVDTLNVAPGERYTVLVHTPAEVVGAWAFHCHILTHAENDDGLFGMVTAWVVAEPEPG